MSSSATSSSSSRIYAQPLEDVVRVATLGRSSFGANLAKVSSLLKGEGFISMYVLVIPSSSTPSALCDERTRRDEELGVSSTCLTSARRPRWAEAAPLSDD